MDKTLVFTDAHREPKESYDALAEVCDREAIKRIMFLGDLDSYDCFCHFRDFMDSQKKKGKEVVPILGNHEQAWIDYVSGKEGFCFDEEEKDPALLKNKEEFLDLMMEFDPTHSIDNILFTHAFPLGWPLSGPHKNNVYDCDPRLKHFRLWQYSFNTYDNDRVKQETVGERFEKYDPNVIRMNFDRLKKLGKNFMIKGHEHVQKIWYGDRPLDENNGKIIPPVTTLEIPSPAIIQVGAFHISGHYAILDKISLDKLNVRFLELDLMNNTST